MIIKNYIKMCETAIEIQAACKYEGGEYFLNVAGEIEIMHLNLTERMKGWFRNYYHLYLPTQEKLWNMLPEIKDKVHVVFRFNKFLSGKYISEMQISQQRAFVVLMNTPKEDEEDFSITELLFCFIMSEKYNKIWTGEKWEEIK